MMHAQTQERPAFVLDVFRMDYSQYEKPFCRHPLFDVWQRRDEFSDKIVYCATFHDPALYPTINYPHATEAILCALKKVGELKLA
jgi:hypothetical protein